MQPCSLLTAHTVRSIKHSSVVVNNVKQVLCKTQCFVTCAQNSVLHWIKHDMHIRPRDHSFTCSRSLMVLGLAQTRGGGARWRHRGLLSRAWILRRQSVPLRSRMDPGLMSGNPDRSEGLTWGRARERSVEESLSVSVLPHVKEKVCLILPIINSRSVCAQTKLMIWSVFPRLKRHFLSLCLLISPCKHFWFSKWWDFPEISK